MAANNTFVIRYEWRRPGMTASRKPGKRPVPMPHLPRLFLLTALILAAPLAHADQGWYPLHADDGAVIANYRVPVELESQIEKLPGVTVLGNPHGVVTLNEFYDLNCPYCRKAAGEIDKLLRSVPELRLVLVEVAAGRPPGVHRCGRLSARSVRAALPARADGRQE